MKRNGSTESGIIRVEHDSEHPYKTINTSFANDERLSWGARGILTYLLSKPNDWVMTVKDLINQSPAGRDAVYGMLRNLEDCGYLRRVRSRRPDGTFEYATVIYEKAQPLTDYPDTVQPDTVHPFTEKPDIYLIRNELSKERLNKELSGGGDARAREEEIAAAAASDNPPIVSRDVTDRLFAILENTGQVEIAVAAAAAARGGFSVADVELCECWLDAQRPEWSGKVGSLYKELKAGRLPVIPRPRAAPSSHEQGTRRGPPMAEKPNVTVEEAERLGAARRAHALRGLPAWA